MHANNWMAIGTQCPMIIKLTNYIVKTKRKIPPLCYHGQSHQRVPRGGRSVQVVAAQTLWVPPRWLSSLLLSVLEEKNSSKKHLRFEGWRWENPNNWRRASCWCWRCEGGQWGMDSWCWRDPIVCSCCLQWEKGDDLYKDLKCMIGCPC